jgi:hypothetical protein
MGKQGFSFIDRKEPPWTDRQRVTVNSGTVNRVQQLEGSPRASPQSERQLLAGRRDCLVSTGDGTPLALAELRKAKAIKFVRIRICSFVCMSSTRRDGDERARGNRHPIGKCKWSQRETAHSHWDGRVAHVSSRYLACWVRNSTNGSLDRQVAGSPSRNCLSYASCPFQLSSSLLLLSQPRPLGGEVRYIEGYPEDDTMFV